MGLLALLLPIQNSNSNLSLPLKLDRIFTANLFLSGWKQITNIIYIPLTDKPGIIVLSKSSNIYCYWENTVKIPFHSVFHCVPCV